MIVTAVTYDYVLTFSREVHYIWHRPWTWVSTMFLLVRYVGLCGVILIGFDGSTFVSGPVIICTVIYIAISWEFAIFIAAADVVMILRVYAMWNRSNRILSFLLFIYVPQVIITFVFTGIYNNPNTYLSVSTIQVADVSICSVSITNLTAQIWHFYASIPRFILIVILFVLAVIPALKESFEMYKATKQWQSNRYLQQLLRDGAFYFLLNVLLTTYRILQSQLASTDASLHFLTSISYVILFPMMPRFIISIRELSDRDLRGCWQGIDTGFGVLSQPVVSDIAVVSAIAFADVTSWQGQGQVVVGDADDSEAIWFEVPGDGMRRGVEGDADDSKAIRLGVFGDGTCQV